MLSGIPLYLSVSIICLSDVPSYYIPASIYFRKVGRGATTRFVVGVPLVFWGLGFS